MSGHSKWATIKRKKGAIDARRGAQFTKAAKEITMASRAGGGDPDLNARLRAAIQAAKAINMPNANVDRAIKRGTGEIEGAQYEEVTYEGYAPGGVAVMVETATDNRNRTFPEVRKIFEKCGGTLGGAGSVGFLFERKGVIEIPAAATSEERLMELCLEAGGEDIETDEGLFRITTGATDFHAVLKALDLGGIEPSRAELELVASTSAKVEGKEAEQVLRLVEMLEDHDDVQHVWANFDIDDDTLAASA
jgi:YebC/PmpR family DNA-binding regulatory protein